MKNRSIKSLACLLIVAQGINTTWAQNNPFTDAMKQELKRSMDSLRIDKMLPPNFISYSIVDAKTLQIEAVLGGIVKSEERPFRSFENRLTVGENGKTNENFLDLNNMWSWSRYGNEIPFSDNKDDIRRALWLVTDNNYKNAITVFKAKMSAISQQGLTNEEKQLEDFCSADRTELFSPYTSCVINKAQLEGLARKLSAVFREYPAIQRSYVNVFVYDANVFFANSEGSSCQYPLQVVSVKVIAITQTPGGEALDDHVLWFNQNPSQLPDEKSMIEETEKMAKNITSLTTAHQVSEPYSGPVLFEGEAAAEVFVQKFFGNMNGLTGIRKPIVGSEQMSGMAGDKIKENSLEAMLNKKIISRDLSIEAFPAMTSYEKVPLIGSYQVDAEGVKAPDKVVLVENGVLRNLICNRTPTQKMKRSNGHARAAISNGGIKTVVAPSVIKLTNNNPATSVNKTELKKMLLAAAKEEDLEYAYIVRKVVSDAAGDLNEKSNSMIFFGGDANSKKDLSKTIQVYRVKVSDGTEELVSLAEIEGLSTKSFKRLLATSSQMQVYNTMDKPINSDLYDWSFKLTGVPASFIVPDGLLFQELDVVKEKQDIVKTLPSVSNPLTAK